MKKLHLIGAVLLAGAVFTGCEKKADQATAPEAADKEAAVKAAPAKDPNEVCVTVNGKELKRGEIDAKVEKQIAAQMANIPAEHLDEARKQFALQVAQQFLFENAIAPEAIKGGFAATEKEFNERVAEIIKGSAGRPNPPKTLEDIAKQNNLSKEEAEALLRNGIAIDKMIKAETAKNGKDYKAEAQKIIDDIIAKENGEKVRASHILIKGGDEKADAAALAKIKELQVALADKAVTNVPAKFAELATANSACPSSSKGGDLGPFGKGQMVPEFDKVAFTLPVGKVSEPVKTQFGYHLILVTEKIPAGKAKPGEGNIPKIEDVIKYLEQQDGRAVAQEMIVNIIRKADVKASEEFKRILPPPEAPAKPDAKPAVKPVAKSAEKPVEPAAK